MGSDPIFILIRFQEMSIAAFLFSLTFFYCGRVCSVARNMYIAGTTNKVKNVPIEIPVKITSPIL